MAEPRIEPVPRGLGGQRLRLSQDNPSYGPAYGGSYFLLGQPDHETQWRNLSLDSNTLDRMAPADLLELLVDLSPDISKALWDFLRLCNPGWEVQALRPGGSDAVDTRAQAALDLFMGDGDCLLKELYGSPDVVVNWLFFSAFLRGGFFAELVLDKAGRLPVDLVAPDPRWLSWRRKADPVRGTIWEPFQWQGSQAVSLAVPTIRYVPVDPMPGKPYGRPLAHPSLFTTIFALGMLHDLRRVIQQQGYPRLDLEIVIEVLKQAMPPGLASDPNQVKAWMDSIVAEINTVYSGLEPDDAYVHPDWVKINRPVGTVDSDSLGAIDGLMQALERQQVRALKSTPLMMGMTDGVSEANANRQWEIHAAGVKALQHLAEGLLEELLTLALRVQGIQANVKFRFSELRAAELLRDAQVEQLNIENASAQYAAGWIDQAAAAKKGAGVDKPAEKEPRQVALPPGGGAPDAADVQPEPGGNRSRRKPATLLEGILQGMRDDQRAKVTPEGGAPDDALPDADALADEAKAAAEKAMDSWDAGLPGFAELLDAGVTV